MGIHIRLYRALLRCYPASYRQEYGFELQEVFAARTESLTGLGAITIGCWLAIADVLPNALAVHGDILARDVRNGLRVMRRSPVLFGSSFAILAVGIGTNGAVFSLLQAVMLKPLPYHEPSRVVMLWQSRAPTGELATNRGAQRRLSRTVLTSQHAMEWRENTTDVFSDFAAIDLWQGNLSTQFDLQRREGAERLRGALVTPNFFDLLGVEAAIGRTFAGYDAEERGSPLVISHALWMRVFGGDDSIVGQPLTMMTGSGRARAARTFTIIGVLPREFHFTYPDETEAFGMMTWSDVAAMNPQALGLRAVARLRDGITQEVAAQRVTSVYNAMQPLKNGEARRKFSRIEPIEEWVVGDSRPSLMLLAAVSLLLFIITCTTVANALFIRIAARHRELAVRAALGADPRRLVRQLLTEGALLGTMGAMSGSLVAVLMLPLLRRLVPSIMPRADEIGLSVWILAFAAAAAATVVLIAALMPALRAGRIDLVGSLKRTIATASVDRSSSRWRTGLVGVQSAIAASLLIVAALLTVSAFNLARSPLGFEADDVLTFEMRILDGTRRDPAELVAFQSRMLDRVRSMPGVVDAGITTAVPFRGVDFLRGINRVGVEEEVMGNERVVDSSFFSIMRVALLQGRLFNREDRLDAPLAIIMSESFARSMFGSTNAIGQRVKVSEEVATVVGIVEDLRYQSLNDEPRPAYYLSSAQTPSALFCIVVRAMGASPSSIVAEAQAVDRGLPIMNVTTIDRIIEQSTAVRRFYTTATVAFALVALLLTITGLVLIVARTIAERRHELAIRSALGATARRLVAMVTLHGFLPVGIGATAGIAVALGASGIVADFLFQVSPREPSIYAAVAVVVAAVGACAALVPAALMVRVHPAEALRGE